MRSFFLFLIFTLSFDLAAKSPPWKLRKGLTYCKVGRIELKLDAITPTGKGPFPVLVFVHGGSWSEGSRHYFDHALIPAARQGFVALTLDHRLTQKKKNPFPVQLHDVRCALRWLVTHAQKLQVDPQKIGMVGFSSGAHLSLLSALMPPAIFAEKKTQYAKATYQIKAVANFGGPLDLQALYEAKKLEETFSTVFGGRPALEASPLIHLKASSPPIITFHGRMDAMVPVEQAIRFDQAAKKVGASHRLIIYENDGHEIRVEENQRHAEQEMYLFFKGVLQKS